MQDFTIQADEAQATVAYEPPMLLDAGSFAEQTRGWFGDWPDHDSGLWL
ncbi:lasso RiPP family leader peptide-containing protein [Amycolatopsis sp. NPDC052450]